jgi:hypothetical protein
VRADGKIMLTMSRDVDGVGQHVARRDAVLSEEGDRVSSLVLKDALVADRIDHDLLTRVYRENRGV